MLVNPSDVIFHQPIKCNTFNSNGNNDVVLQRNGVEFMKFDSTDNKIHCPKELRIIGGAGKLECLKQMKLHRMLLGL
jgi:hypothetical protein